MAVDADIQTDGRPIARWTRLGILGQLLAVGGIALMLIAVLAFGLETEGETTFFLTIAAISLVGAFFAWRFGWWGKLIGAVSAFVAAGALFWTAFGLEAFPSFFDFVPGVLVMPGSLMALVCYIAAIVAGRRGNTSYAASGRERSAIRVVLAVVAVVAILAGVLTHLGRTSIDPDTADAIVVMSNFEFAERVYTFEPGAKVLAQNDDPFMHTFTVEELDIDETLTAGDRALITMPNEPGEYVLYCRPHTETPDEPEYDSDMAARLQISG